MAHEIDNTTGRAGMAYIGEAPWHGLGQKLTEGATLETWQAEAGLDWECVPTPVEFKRAMVDCYGMDTVERREAKGHRVLYRSDTGAALSIVSDRYRPVQPRDVIEFYRDLVDSYGFQLETAGSLKGGRKIWALANTRNAVSLRGGDDVGGYLLLATSFDGSMATQARFTSVRVVCNNTLTIAAEGRADVTVRHSTDFDASKVKLDLGISERWQDFARAAAEMTKRPVTQEESVRFLLDVYMGLDTPEKIAEHKADKSTEAADRKFFARMQTALFNSPGAHMESARGMLWGLVNAVTYDVDHNAPARSRENRLDKAWFGAGENVKARALELAYAYLDR